MSPPLPLFLLAPSSLVPRGSDARRVCTPRISHPCALPAVHHSRARANAATCATSTPARDGCDVKRASESATAARIIYRFKSTIYLNGVYNGAVPRDEKHRPQPLEIITGLAGPSTRRVTSRAPGTRMQLNQSSLKKCHWMLSTR